MTKACRICGKSNLSNQFVLQDFHSAEVIHFDYYLCDDCSTLQIADIPNDLQKYYSDKYYSMIPPKANRFLFRTVRKLRNLVSLKFPFRSYHSFASNLNRPDLHALNCIGYNSSMKLCDVGCGQGHMLRDLHELGFKGLVGIDPFLPSELVDANLMLLNENFLDHASIYDVIMFNHSFEHMADPWVILKKTYELLAPGGFCIIRIPVLDSYVWRQFKTNWIQLDAPRHLFIYSAKSIQLLACHSNFAVARYYCDSGIFQFADSRLIRQKCDDGQSFLYGGNILFSRDKKRTLAELGMMSRRLNMACDGDQATFILRKRPGS